MKKKENLESGVNIYSFLKMLFPLKASVLSLVVVGVSTYICFIIMKDRMLANEMLIDTSQNNFNLLFMGIAFPILSWPFCVFIGNVLVKSLKEMTHWSDLILVLNPIMLIAFSIPTLGFIGLAGQSLASYTVIQLLIPS